MQNSWSLVYLDKMQLLHDTRVKDGYDLAIFYRLSYRSFQFNGALVSSEFETRSILLNDPVSVKKGGKRILFFFSQKDVSRYKPSVL